jgi:acetyl esterase/lipase
MAIIGHILYYFCIMKALMRRIVPIAIIVLCSCRLPAQQVIPLYYPDVIPNSIPHPDEQERTTNDKGVVLVGKVSRPTLTLFLPAHVNGNTPAVVICPGGGYWINAVNIEGYDEAKVLNSWGVAAFVLTYRIPDSAYCIHPEIAPLQDAQEAILQVRRNAARWHIDPRQVGIMGFSAGGHLASTAGTHFDRILVPDPENISVRPDWMILGYPVISSNETISHRGSFEKLLGKNAADSLLRYFSNELQVTDSTPPAFIVHAQDDHAVPAQNSIVFYQALTAHHVRAELHIYEQGGHGFGLYVPNRKELWMDRCKHWMELNGWIK